MQLLFSSIVPCIYKPRVMVESSHLTCKVKSFDFD